MRFTYTHTRIAAYLSFVTMAVAIMLPTLLFATYQKEFDISMEKIGGLILALYFVQVCVLAVVPPHAERIGYRTIALAMHLFAFVGIAGIGVFPYVFPTPYMGILAAMSFYAVAAALMDTVVNPIIEALPGDHKDMEMSLLHSVFTWGCAVVALVSTLYFSATNMENWHYVPLAWSLVPVVCFILFTKVPIAMLVEPGEGMPLKKLFSKRLFLLFFVVILCAGPAEQSIAQWASLFAELGLNVSKTTGDLLGPCAFMILMALARTYYGFRGHRLNLEKTMLGCSAAAFACYMVTVFSPSPMLSLVACALSGFFIGIIWPGALSLAAREFPKGGATMFGVLALAGYIGCSAAGWAIGYITETVSEGGLEFLATLFTGADMVSVGLKSGLLVASVFPLVMTAMLWRYCRRRGGHAPVSSRLERAAESGAN